MQRGGGAEDRGDGLRNRMAAMNCSQLCYYVMMPGGAMLHHDSIPVWGGRPFWYQLPLTQADAGHVHYAKCHTAPSPTPLNNKRFQFPSQEGTSDIDPSVPKMNLTDWISCIGKFSVTFH